MENKYEIEIKSLLGSAEEAEKLRSKLRTKGGLKELGHHSQLNHYFTAANGLAVLKESILPLVPTDQKELLEKILVEGRNYSIRTRDADGKVLFVIKASIGDDTSANGVSRMEFEAPIQKTIDELDQVLLAAGLEYQAKWSRDREEYQLGETNITIDRNAGYGYLAEFERVIEDQAGAEAAKADLVALMADLGVIELAQDRLERMFAFYNTHWQDYYGTDRIFNIE
ncbi:MAG: CYTH domain-containing protein [bacterium]|nr:CYTH domain-containing protein [bacterium]